MLATKLGGGNSNIFQCSPRSLGKWCNLTTIVQLGWDHQTRKTVRQLWPFFRAWGASRFVSSCVVFESMILPTYPWNICQISPKPNKNERTSFTSWLNGQKRLVKYTQVIQCDLSSPSWRSRSHWKGSLNHPKRVTKNCQVHRFCISWNLQHTPAGQDTPSQTSVTAWLDVHPFWRSAQQKLLRKNGGEKWNDIPLKGWKWWSWNVVYRESPFAICKGWFLRENHGKFQGFSQSLTGYVYVCFPRWWCRNSRENCPKSWRSHNESAGLSKRWRGQNWQNLVVFHGKSEGPKVQLPPKCHRKKPQERMAFIEGLSTTIIPKNKAEK